MLVKKNNNNSISVYVVNDSSSPNKEVSSIWETPYTVKQGGMNDTILYDFTNLWE